MKSTAILALAAVLPSTLAYRGFNYGNLDSAGAVKAQAAYEGEFNSAKNLANTNGAFSSARLYTSRQGDTDAPIEAIPAAIATDTTLLLGIWASGVDAAGVEREVNAIKAAIEQFGEEFTSRVAGISVGNEDVYRVTALGVASNAGPGVSPQGIADFVTQVRSSLQGTALSGAKIGHVDTYNTFANSSGWMAPVIEASDFIGMNAFPYFEDTKPNSIDNGNATFWADYDAVKAVAGGKEIWITETGWPTVGPTSGEAVPSVENAERYYAEAGCAAFGAGINTWWYTLADSSADASVPSFGVTGQGNPPPTTPKYDLSC